MSTFNDWFAGAGGWSTGIRAAGGKVLTAVNHWPTAVATHALNHPETEHRCEDAGRVDLTTVPHADYFVASPACQGHSPARGRERPHHDLTRATAFCVVSYVEVHRPKAFAVENVANFQNWVLFPVWRQALEVLGYKTHVQLVDAADFGAPQNRPRLIITGSAKGWRIESPNKRAPTAEEIIDWGSGNWTTTENLVPRTQEKLRLSRAKYGRRFLLPFYGATKVGRAIDRPIATITTKDRFLVVDGDRKRMLSVDEAKRAMSFPASYRLTGNRAEQMKQLGNAVCPAMAQGIAEQMEAA